MLKKSRGFTLIELLIVVAIVGILAALLVPNAITAIQKAKQKSTMKDIVVMGTGCIDFITDNGSWDGVTQAGDIALTFRQILAPFYIKTCPESDGWGNIYQVEIGDAVSSRRDIPALDVSEDDFLIESLGRGGADDGWVWVANQPEGGMYTVTSMPDFLHDLVNWSGSWIRAPRTARASGS